MSSNRGIHPHQVQAALIRRVIEHLNALRNSDSQVVVSSGFAIGADDGAMIFESLSDITIDITSSGVNGLDTGSEAPNTWYYVYLIWNPTSGLVRGLFSASATSPVLPSGYTKKRLISAVRNNASSNFLPFQQRNADIFYLADTYVVGTWATSGWQTLDFSSYAPTLISRKILISGYCWTQNGGGSQWLYYAPSSSPSPGVALNHTRNTSTEAYIVSQSSILLASDGTAQFYISSAVGTAYGATVSVAGFTLDL